MGPAHFHLCTDNELHRIARDSSNPLVLELLRRLDAKSDALCAVASDTGQDAEISVLRHEVRALTAHMADLEEQLESFTTLNTNN
jgi:hypothetical protein